jgi:hypothetical protein
MYLLIEISNTLDTKFYSRAVESEYIPLAVSESRSKLLNKAHQLQRSLSRQYSLDEKEHLIEDDHTYGDIEVTDVTIQCGIEQTIWRISQVQLI